MGGGWVEPRFVASPDLRMLKWNLLFRNLFTVVKENVLYFLSFSCVALNIWDWATKHFTALRREAAVRVRSEVWRNSQRSATLCHTQFRDSPTLVWVELLFTPPARFGSSLRITVTLDRVCCFMCPGLAYFCLTLASLSLLSDCRCRWQLWLCPAHYPALFFLRNFPARAASPRPALLRFQHQETHDYRLISADGSDFLQTSARARRPMQSRNCYCRVPQIPTVHFLWGLSNPRLVFSCSVLSQMKALC